MTRTLLQMAEEAGAITNIKTLCNHSADSIVFMPEELEVFAELIREDQREKCAQTFLQNVKGCWTNAEMADMIAERLKQK